MPNLIPSTVKSRLQDEPITSEYVMKVFRNFKCKQDGKVRNYKSDKYKNMFKSISERLRMWKAKGFTVTVSDYIKRHYDMCMETGVPFEPSVLLYKNSHIIIYGRGTPNPTVIRLEYSDEMKDNLEIAKRLCLVHSMSLEKVVDVFNTNVFTDKFIRKVKSGEVHLDG